MTRRRSIGVGVWAPAGAVLLPAAVGCRSGAAPPSSTLPGVEPVVVAAARPQPPAVEEPEADQSREEPSGLSRKARAEIAWLRSTWPSEMQGVRTDSLLPKLLRWVPRGLELRAYLCTHRHECQLVLLTRSEDEQEREQDQNPSESGGEPWDPELMGRVVSDGVVKGGVTSRGYVPVHFRDTLHEDTGGGTEELQPDGSWKEVMGWGGGDGGTNHGALVYVNDDVARFGGEALSLQAECATAWGWLACAGGGERQCKRCAGVRLDFRTPNQLLGWDEAPAPRVATRQPTCSDPCPRRSHPYLDRLRELSPEIRFWREGDDPAAERPSLYRSQARCRREHPPRSP